MMSGIMRYRHHPYRRQVTNPPPVWEEGTTRLLDMRCERKSGKSDDTRYAPVLLVPSLINRGYILDLHHDHSFARWLAEQGLDVFLLDWDAPGETEQNFTLTDYIARLNRAAMFVNRELDAPISLVGYCMGGMLTLASALALGPKAASLTLMATPWDFHSERADQARLIGQSALLLEPAMAAAGNLPVDLLQALFASLDPWLALNKFAKFAAFEPESERAEAFVALEDWLNDGVPLTTPVARECLAGWYGRNDPAQGRWRIAGTPVRPEDLSCPTLAVIPANDRIVPPTSAEALAAQIKGARTLRPTAGHIGMMAGKRAITPVWEPIADFLKEAVR